MQQSIYMNPELGAEFAALLDSHRRLVFKVARTYTSAADVEDLALFQIFEVGATHGDPAALLQRCASRV